MGILWFAISLGIMALPVHYVPGHAKDGFDVAMVALFVAGFLSAIIALAVDFEVWIRYFARD